MELPAGAIAGDAMQYTAAIGDQVRVGLDYRGGWRPMFWFELAKDGSVYLGPRFKVVWGVRKGFTTAPGPAVTLDFDAGELLASPRLVYGGVIGGRS